MLGMYIGVNTNELEISREADVLCICPLAFCISFACSVWFQIPLQDPYAALAPRPPRSNRRPVLLACRWFHDVP